MKKLLILLWVILLFPVMGNAQSLTCSLEKPCTFFWNANTETDLEGYKFYVKPEGGAYGTPLDIKQPQSAIGVDLFKTQYGSLAAGNYVAAVSAYDRAGNESGKSNEVAFTFVVPDLPPAIPILQIYVTVP